MQEVPLYPLRFEPIFLGRLWGGRRLGEWLGRKLPAGPVGEAWVLSDRDDHPSVVAEGPLQGKTLPELMAAMPERLLGSAAKRNRRFPLLMKFLDARDILSLQVHPDDHHVELLPPGERGKTEAWVVLEADPGSRIFAGLKPGTTAADLRAALRVGEAPAEPGRLGIEHLLCRFTPKPGDCVFLPAGTVHALGAGLLLFEVQQNSDVTFRLFDWDRVDAKTGQPRQLHIEQALACIDYSCNIAEPVTPELESEVPLRRERMVECKHFTLWRLGGSEPFTVGASGECRVLVGIGGDFQLRQGNSQWRFGKGAVVFLPAEVGRVDCQPIGPAALLECAIPG